MLADLVISVLIAEDQTIMRMGLRAALRTIPGVQIVGEAVDGQAAVDLANQLNPAIIFMDVGMPRLDGIQATRAIKQSRPDVRIIMFTSKDDPKAFMGALSAGADGYCLKDATEQQLAGAISAVMQGATWLDSGVAKRALQSQGQLPPPGIDDSQSSAFTDQEREVLGLVAKGLTFNQIGETLHRSLAGLKVDLNVILDKLRGTGEAPSPETTYSQSQQVCQSAKLKLADSDRTSNIQIGQVLGGKYAVEAVIGEGGMSTVYRARHTLMDKVVAVKMLHMHLLTDPIQVKRMQNEARAAGSISHPNIVAVHDFGISEESQPYLVMDYVAGESLAEMLHREKSLPIKLCLELLIQVCDALDALHSHGIIHRDLKSSNIMLIKDKGKLMAKLVDFGIAKTISSTLGNGDLTLTGEVFGSPAYMSPEQCLGHAVDIRSDLYSLGCVLYQMLTGAIPFAGEEPLNVMWQQVHELPSRLPFLGQTHDVPISLQDALFQLLNKDPVKRFQTADRLKFEFETILNTIDLESQTRASVAPQKGL